MALSLLTSAVEDLFSKFSVTDIIIFCVLIALAIKEIITLIDWFKNRGKNRYKKETESKLQQAQIQKIIDTQNLQNEQIQDMKHCIEMLIISDKNDIKAWITERYHQLMLKGWVDNYELDCLERRYSDYRQEGGNSYIEDLMEDIRKLPKTSRVEK